MFSLVLAWLGSFFTRAANCPSVKISTFICRALVVRYAIVAAGEPVIPLDLGDSIQMDFSCIPSRWGAAPVRSGENGALGVAPPPAWTKKEFFLNLSGNKAPGS